MKSLVLFLGIYLTTGFYAFASDTAGLLTKIYQLSSEATQVGRLASGKLDDPRLVSYNNRLINDHNVTKKTLTDTASQLGIDIPENIGANKASQALGNLDGAALRKEYLKKEIDIHSQLVSLLKSKLPEAQSPVVKAILGNLSSRFSGLLDNAQTLQKEATGP